MSGDTDSAELTKGLRERPQPEWCAPMLAVLTDDRFSHKDWIYERKLDGERVLVFRDEGGVRLMTRNRHDVTDTWPELADALSRQSARAFVADGEVVAFEGAVTSFSRLQGRMQISDPDRARASRIKVLLYLFDLMHIAGHDLTGHALATDAATAVYLADQGCVELHLALARADTPDHPDRMIFDLDPSDGDFAKVQEVARAVRTALDDRGLQSFVATTGSRGLHVVLSLDGSAEVDALRPFARMLAAEVAEAHPTLATTEQRKARRDT